MNNSEKQTNSPKQTVSNPWIEMMVYTCLCWRNNKVEGVKTKAIIRQEKKRGPMNIHTNL